MKGRPSAVAERRIALANAEELAQHPRCFGNDGPTRYVATTRSSGGKPLRRFVCAVHGQTFAQRHNLTIPKSPNRKDDSAR